MGIFVSIEDKDGESLSKVIGIHKLMLRFKESGNTCCLQFISELEDAVFNQLQLKVLVSELNHLASKNLQKEEKEELDQILKLCDKIKGKNNSSIIFYGEKVPDF